MSDKFFLNLLMLRNKSFHETVKYGHPKDHILQDIPGLET